MKRRTRFDRAFGRSGDPGIAVLAVEPPGPVCAITLFFLQLARKPGPGVSPVRVSVPPSSGFDGWRWRGVCGPIMRRGVLAWKRER